MADRNYYAFIVNQERRGLRLLFDAAAEVASETSPSSAVAARLTELSLYRCYLDIPAPFEVKARVLVKIFHSDEYFEAKATVVYVKPTLGMGLAFRDVRPNFREILQKWILVAMNNQKQSYENT